MHQGGGIVLSLAIDACCILLHLEKHFAQPIALRPAPVALVVVRIFSRNVGEEIARIKPIASLKADHRLVIGADFHVQRRLTTKLFEGGNVEPALVGRHEHIARRIPDEIGRAPRLGALSQGCAQIANRVIKPVARGFSALRVRPQQIGEFVRRSAVAALMQQIGEQRLGLARRAPRGVPDDLRAVVAIDAQASEAADLPAVARLEAGDGRLLRRLAQQPHRVRAFGRVNFRPFRRRRELGRNCVEPMIDLLAKRAASQQASRQPVRILIHAARRQNPGMAAQGGQHLFVDHQPTIVKRDDGKPEVIRQPLGDLHPGLEIGGRGIGGENPAHIRQQDLGLVIQIGGGGLDPGADADQRRLERQRRFQETGLIKSQAKRRGRCLGARSP